MKESKTKILFIGIIVVLLLFISFSSARLGEYPRGSCVNIKTILNTSSVNISTISFVNGSTAVSNQEMTKVGSTFNFSFCQTQEDGVYNYDYFDAEGNVFVNDFLINKNGTSVNTGESMMYIWILIFIFIFMCGFIFLSIVIPFSNETKNTKRGISIIRVTKTKYLKLMSIWFSYGLLLMFVTVVTGMTNNYIQFSAMKEMFTRIYLFLVVVGYGFSTGMIWFIFINVWHDIILNKKILSQGQAFLRDL